MRYPSFPITGDTIGICAPSRGVGHKIESFDLSLSHIKKCEFKIKETPSVRNDASPSASAIIRGHEFNNIWADKNVSAIISASGGDFNFEMLPYIDTEAIKSDPKWFAGYSDPTNIQMFITTKLDIATIYGFNAGGFDSQNIHEFQNNALEIFKGNLVSQHSYEYYDSSKDFSDEVNMDTPVKWELFSPDNNTSLDVTGRLIGGCTEIIDLILGTPYEDFHGFIDRYQDDGFIWFFDTYNADAVSFYLKILKMKTVGLFKNAKVLIFGRVMFTGGSTDEEYIELLQRAFPDVPFIWGADIGHTKPSMTLINGAIGHLKMKNNKAILDMDLR